MSQWYDAGITAAATIDQAPPATQLTLPFLTAERAAIVDAARVVVERSCARAIVNHHHAEALELERLGDQLLELLTDNSAAVRAAHA